MLGEIFKSFYNVSIELIVDACREPNPFEEKFRQAAKEVPTVKVEETNFTTLSERKMTTEDDETQRITSEPWPGKPEVNNIFIRNYACKYGEFTDAVYSVGYAEKYNDRFEEMNMTHGFVLMPNHFLKTSGFKFKNKMSGSENDVAITYRIGDDMPAKNKRTQICLMTREQAVEREDRRVLEETKN